MSTQIATKSYLLRRALQWNAAFSIISGTIMLTMFSPLGQFMGVELPALYIVIGASLIVFSAGLMLNARREDISLTEAKISTLMDVVWVIGSIIVVFLPGTGLTLEGKWAIAIVADIVALFALLQYIGLRRLQRS